MSATGRGAVRREHDAYYTPRWAVDAILPHLPLFGDVLDPFCGDGGILEAVHAYSCKGPDDLLGIDIDEKAVQAAQSRSFIRVQHGDAFDPSLSWRVPDLVITNPPYTHAERAFRTAIENVHSEGTVAMLLRLGFLEGQKRSAFHREFPTDVYVLPRRPSFTGDGKTDASGYGWFVWTQGKGGKWRVL